MVTSMNKHPPDIFSIATGSAEPIYRQLLDQVRRLTASSHLLPGDLMPSVREVAQTLALNPMTVSKAYNMLETEGLLQRHRGQGMLVAQASQTARSLPDRLRLLQPTLERAAAEARQLELDAASALSLFQHLLEGKQ